ncbi:MAG: glycosyltransferase [Thermaerobacter sp.]|nr:glycosyltransferase [Thermaerobacter sp.]
MTHKDDVVSVVVPCYNQGLFLGEALQSLADQTYPALEVIVVDDGSGLDTQSEIRRLQARYSFTLVTQANGGLSRARNVGIAHASGRYILPLDADNRLAPAAITQLVERMRSAQTDNPDVMFVYQDKVLFGLEDRYVPHQPYNLYRLLTDNFADACCLIDRRIFDWGFQYNETMKDGYEDWEFHLRLGVYGFQGVRLAGHTFLYRRWGYSMVNAADQKKRQLMAKIESELATLYLPRHQRAIKRVWAPGLSLMGSPDPTQWKSQTFADWVPSPDQGSFLQQLATVRGRFVLVLMDNPGLLTTDRALFEKLLTVAEWDGTINAIAIGNADGPRPSALLLASRFLFGELLALAPQSADALWALTETATSLRWWDPERQQLSDRPVVHAGRREKRISRWLKNFGKRFIAPRVGFDNAYQTFYHLYQAGQIIRRSLAHPQPPLAGTASDTLAPDDRGILLDQGFRHYTPLRFYDGVAAAPPVTPSAAWHPENPPPVLGHPDWIAAHAARHTPTTNTNPVIGEELASVFRALPHSRRTALLGADSPEIITQLGLQGPLDIFEFSSPTIESLKQSPPHAGVYDLAFAVPADRSYDVVVTGQALAHRYPQPDLMLRAQRSLTANGTLIAPEFLQPSPDPRMTATGGSGGWMTWRRSRLKVFVIAPHLVQGGADRALVDLIRGLPGERYDIVFVTTEPADNTWISLVLPQVSEYWDLGSLLADDNARIELLVELIKRKSPDVAYIMHSKVGYDTLPHFRAHRVKTLLQFHLEEPGGGWIGYATSRYQNLVDRYVVINQHLKDRLRTTYYVEPHKVDVIYLGVNLPPNVPPLSPDERLHVVVPVRLDPQKAPHRLIPIAQGLKDGNIPATIHVLGDGPLRHELETGIGQYGLDRQLVLHGTVPADAMAAWYEKTHAVLLTSDYEGLPLVLLEGMAHARAIVAPDIGAIRELFKDHVGILIPDPADIGAYVNALRSLAKDRRRMIQMGLNGREAAMRDFNQARTEERYRALFENLLGEPDLRAKPGTRNKPLPHPR